MKLLTSVSQPTLRWYITLMATTSVIIILLNPGRKAANSEISFSSFISSFFELSYNLKDFAETSAHVMLFGILTILWYWVLIEYFPRFRAYVLTLIIVVTLAIGTEIGQYFVNRGVSLLDLLANYIGIGISIFWIHRKKINT